MTEAIAKYEARNTSIAQYSPDEIDLIKTQIAPGTTDKELALFMTVANRRRLDPFKGQIFAIKRPTYDKAKGAYVDKMTIQIAHAGLLALAERTNGYRGATDPQFAGEDGKWVDVWLSTAPPAACKVGVYRKGFAAPVMGMVLWREYVQTGKDGNPIAQWKEKPTHMLEKCALSKALRRAFPDMEDTDDADYDTDEPEVEYVETTHAALRVVPPDAEVDLMPYAHATPEEVYETITLTNDVTGETIEVAQPAPPQPSGDDALKAATAKMKAQRGTTPVATEKFTPDYADPEQMSAMWAAVKGWAADHGSDPQRLRFYLATAAGGPEKVSQEALKAWLTAHPDNTLDRLYALYVDGETAFLATQSPTEPVQGAFA